MFQQAPATIAVLRGPQHVFELANPPYLATVGRRDLLGKPIRDALPEIKGQGFFEMLDTVYATGEGVIGNETPARLDRRGDGVLDGGFFNFVFQPLLDVDGTVSGFLIHAVEVTEQVTARHQVEQLEERLRLAVEAADVGIYDWDPASLTLNWDSRTRRIFGVPDEGEVTFDTFNAQLHPDDRESANSAVQAVLNPGSGGDFVTEYRVIHPNGSVRWVHADGRVLFEGEGNARKPVRFLGIVQDATERKRAEAEREQLIREAEKDGRAWSRFSRRLRP